MSANAREASCSGPSPLSVSEESMAITPSYEGIHEWSSKNVHQRPIRRPDQRRGAEDRSPPSRRVQGCLASMREMGLATVRRQAHTQHVRSRRVPPVLRPDPWFGPACGLPRWPQAGLPPKLDRVAEAPPANFGHIRVSPGRPSGGERSGALGGGNRTSPRGTPASGRADGQFAPRRWLIRPEHLGGSGGRGEDRPHHPDLTGKARGR